MELLCNIIKPDKDNDDKLLLNQKDQTLHANPKCNHELLKESDHLHRRYMVLWQLEVMWEYSKECSTERKKY